MNIVYNIALLLLFQFLSAPDKALELQRSCTPADTEQTQKREKASSAIIFRSTDAGQTWQDISRGLPENLGEAGFIANEGRLYLRGENGMYHSEPNSTAPVWKKDISLFPGKPGSIAPAKAGIVAYYFDGQFLQQTKGMGAWLPVYTNFPGKEVRTVFETAGGTLFIASGSQLFKSANSGKTWKSLRTPGPVMKIVESNGVLIATGTEGILRSTDDGENWKWVIREGGVGIAVERIKGGFAAITYCTQSRTRRVRTSYDGGNSWQPIDAGLQPQDGVESIWQPIRAGNTAQAVADSAWRPAQAGSPSQVIADSAWRPASDALPAEAFITSIIQVGENFFCGHPAGIFRSSDRGKSWKLVLPSLEGKVFSLYVSGNVIYALPGNEGC